MSMTGLDVFDTTVQKSNEWLKELGDELHWESRREVYLGMRSAMHALRDRLTPEEAASLASQLPLLLAGVFYDGWSPGSTPVKVRDRQEFLELVREPLHQAKPNADPERVTRTVFELLTRKISGGQVEKVKRMLPEEIRNLWPESTAV